MKLTREPIGKYGGVARLGNRSDYPELPSHALVSITCFQHIGLIRALVNILYTNIILMPGLLRTSGLLLGEFYGDLSRLDEGLIITVWQGRSMVNYRDTGAHGWAVRHLTRLIFGGTGQAFFLTYAPKNGQIPDADDARALALKHGKMMMGAVTMRAASRPR